MNEKTEKIIFFGIIIIFNIVFIYMENRYTDGVKSKLIPLEITYKDSLYLEISSIRNDNVGKVRIVNNSLKWCGSYNSFPENASIEDRFIGNYLNFKIISKKANNDTLVTIDRNRHVKYYNIRSGPCYDAIKDVNE